MPPHLVERLRDLVDRESRRQLNRHYRLLPEPGSSLGIAVVLLGYRATVGQGESFSLCRLDDGGWQVGPSFTVSRPDCLVGPLPPFGVAAERKESPADT